MWWILLACRGPTELNPVAVAGSGYVLNRAMASFTVAEFVDCNQNTVDRVLYQRFSLLSPAPISLPDRPWCALTLKLRNDQSAPLEFGGTTLGTQDQVLSFVYQLNTPEITLKTSFFGKGEELVLVVDPDRLIEPETIIQQATTSGQTDFFFSTTSNESLTMVVKLPAALWVGTLSEAAQHFGSRWQYGEEHFRRYALRQEQGAGCSVSCGGPLDTAWDTAIYLGGTDTGATTSTSSTDTQTTIPHDSNDSTPTSESVIDSRRMLDSGGGSGFCACAGPQDTSAESRSTDSRDSGNSSSFCACGGGDSGFASARPPATFALLGFFWHRRRRNA